MDREKVIKGLENCITGFECTPECPYSDDCNNLMKPMFVELAKDALVLLKEQEKEIKALHLLVEGAEECNFGFGQFPDEYERYKDEIKNMEYIDGMIHIAKRTLEDHEALERGQ